jgi:hypothetical protein
MLAIGCRARERSIVPLLALMLMGCGETAPTTDAAASDATIDDSSLDAFGFRDGSSGVPEATLVDVYVTLYDGGGPFACDNVTCDGRTQYCNISSVGPSGPAHCSALPDGCVPANCDCLPNANLGTGCSCTHATTGDGLVAGCQAP